MTNLTGRPLKQAQQFEAEPSTGRNNVVWRTPAYGDIPMYIAPQAITIRDSKVIQTTRTKAGFVMQYAGEALTEISLHGTTGSSGAEGINILESIYRSEQGGFEFIAAQLDLQRAAAESATAITNTVAQAAQFADPGGIASLVAAGAQQFTNTVFDIFSSPTPTLASLASSVELIYQGVAYRGYFTAFVVTEKAESPGLFDFDLTFTAYAKFGSRRNFMPWHRSGDSTIDSGNLDNLTFAGVRGGGPPAPTAPTQGDTDFPGRMELGARNVNLIAQPGFDLRDED